MQIYWIIVIFFLRVRGDITLSTGSGSENSAHCEVSRDEDDEYCGAICYPIVKPLLRYAALCQGKDSTINELKDQTSAKNVTITELKGELRLAKSNIKSLKEQLKHLGNDILKMGKETKDEVAKIGMQIQAREAEMQSKDKLMDQIREKEAYIANLESKQELKGSRIMDLEKQIKEYQGQLNTKTEEIKAFTARITVLEKEIEVNQAKIKDQETEIKLYQDQLTIKDGLVKSFESTIRDKDSQIKNLTSELELIRGTCEVRSCLPFVNSTDIHSIRLLGMDPFDVPCNSSVSGSGWTVIQRRVNGKVNFNRNWNDYKQGFGDLREDFFLGLEKIHQMTLAQPHELYIQLGKVDGSTSYAHYDDFKIGSEEEGYKLKSIGTHSGTAGDSLKYHLNKKFTTFDQDDDNHKYDNCAKFYGGGWWFSNCADSILNGKYYKDGKRSDSQVGGIYWGSWNKYKNGISLTFTQMMIRPKAP